MIIRHDLDDRPAGIRSITLGFSPAASAQQKQDSEASQNPLFFPGKLHRIARDIGSGRQSVFAFAVLKLRRTRFALTASAWLRHAYPARAKRGAGGGTRTHTTLPSSDFKSLASTSSATSATLIHLAFLATRRKCFAAN